MGRVSLLLSALSNGRFDLLKYAVNDTLHEQYRGKLIPNYFNIVNKCREAGCLGVFLSGAGSTIMTIIDNNDNEFKDKINEFIDDIWDIREFELDLGSQYPKNVLNLCNMEIFYIAQVFIILISILFLISKDIPRIFIIRQINKSRICLISRVIRSYFYKIE